MGCWGNKKKLLKQLNLLRGAAATGLKPAKAAVLIKVRLNADCRLWIVRAQRFSDYRGL
jgi:hypothetical protein